MQRRINCTTPIKWRNRRTLYYIKNYIQQRVLTDPLQNSKSFRISSSQVPFPQFNFLIAFWINSTLLTSGFTLLSSSFFSKISFSTFSNSHFYSATNGALLLFPFTTDLMSSYLHYCLSTTFFHYLEMTPFIFSFSFYLKRLWSESNPKLLHTLVT